MSIEDRLRLGYQTLEKGEAEAAAALFGKLRRAYPGRLDVRLGLGIALSVTGQPAAGLPHLEMVVSRDPANLFGRFNLANTLCELGRFDSAARHYKMVVEAGDKIAPARQGLVTCLLKLGRFAEALPHLRHIAATSPLDPGAWFDLGNACYQLGKFIESRAALQRVLSVDPCHKNTLAKLATINQMLGDSRSVDDFRRLVMVSPDDAEAHESLLFALNFDVTASLADHQRERKRWYERHARSLSPVERPLLPDVSGRRIRIGYVSGYFRASASASAFGPAILFHDSKQFEVHCFSSTPVDDDLTHRFRKSAEYWHDIHHLDAGRIAELIRNAGIDILVDLVGNMSGDHLLVFARKPAPIQVTAWGEPTGTGLPTMDYIFTDDFLIPPEHQKFFTEKRVPLPYALGFLPPEDAPAPARVAERPTFGSFSRISKLTAETIKLWSRVLKAVPEAALILKDGQFQEADIVDYVRRKFAAEGVSADRIEMIGMLPLAEHFHLYHRIDVALDPLPHGGGMTTLDSLYMGVPVVTLPGQTVSSRLAGAALTAIGASELIARTDADYVAAAAELVRSQRRLQAFRGDLRNRLVQVLNPQTYCQEIEAAYLRFLDISPRHSSSI